MDYTAHAKPVDVSFDKTSPMPTAEQAGSDSRGRAIRRPEPISASTGAAGSCRSCRVPSPLFSYVDPAGRLEYDFKKLASPTTPIVPHTVVKASRSCGVLSRQPARARLGLFTTREHPKLSEFKQRSTSGGTGSSTRTAYRSR